MASRSDPHRAERQSSLISIAWIVMPLAWLIVGFSSRHELDADAVSYIDIADACIRGHWRALINGYWSPGYPALLSLWLSIFHPKPAREITVVRLFICLTLVGALVCFRYFMRAFLRYRKCTRFGGDDSVLPDWALEAIGYALFFWVTIYLTPASKNAADVLVVGFVLLAAAFIMRIVGGAGGWLTYLFLGIVLGLAYLSKAAMFPLSFAFFAAAFLAAPGIRRAAPRLLVTFLAFLFIAAPFVYALSKDKGRPTFGDSGAIAYAMCVNYIDLTVYWQGQPPGSGTPKHPVRKVLDLPPVYEYAGPIGGTYPLWYDHSYWYDGVRPHLEIKRQLNVIHIGLRRYFEIFIGELGFLVAGFLVLLLCGGSLSGFLRAFFRTVPLWGPAIACFGMYALVHVEDRFLSGFVILLWASCFAALRMPDRDVTRIVLRAVVVAVVSVMGLQIAVAVGHSASEILYQRAYPDLQVAEALKQMDIAPGERVSYIGDALTDSVWAHLAGVTLVSEIPLRGVSSFWAASADLRSRVYGLLATSGAKAAIAPDVPDEIVPDGWQRVGETHYYILRLPETPPQARVSSIPEK